MKARVLWLSLLCCFHLAISPAPAWSQTPNGSSQFTFIEEENLRTQLVSFLYHFTSLTDRQKSQIAENLTLRILQLHPDESYVQTLSALRDEFVHHPEGVEYLARLLHTTWLARYGNLALDALTYEDADQARTAGLVGLILTAASSWKRPGQWARYARLTRDLFLPLGLGVAASQLSDQLPADVPPAPMAYFNFPIPSEQDDEIAAQAYQQIVSDLAGWGAASGLTRFLLTSTEVAATAQRGASFGSRIAKPLLLIAALSYGVSELTHYIANEVRYGEILSEWDTSRRQLESRLQDSPTTAGPSVESFLQASRRMSFFMFYPVLEIQFETEDEVSDVGQALNEDLDLRTRHFQQVIAILEEWIEGAPIYQGEAYEIASNHARMMADQYITQAVVEVRNSENYPETNEQYQSALRGQFRLQVEQLRQEVAQFPAETEERYLLRVDQAYEQLRRSLRDELWSSRNTNCHYEFEKYEYSNRRLQGRNFNETRWFDFLSMASWQRIPERFRTPLDQNLMQVDFSRQELPLASAFENVNWAEEMNLLHTKWQNEWQRREICRHSPLFLTQTYEYLSRARQSATLEAAMQSLELLVAQKLLIESLLYSN